MPEFLDDVISKNLFCIKFLRTPNNEIPLFNGSSENKLNYFDKHLENIKIGKKEKKNKIGGIFSVKSKHQALYFDVGSSPSKGFSKKRNKGIKSATGKYIVLLDDDCIPEKKFLETIGGNCHTAVGVYAEIKKDKLRIISQLFKVWINFI